MSARTFWCLVVAGRLAYLINLQHLPAGLLIIKGLMKILQRKVFLC